MSPRAKVTEIYETQIKRLPVLERLELLALVARDLAEHVGDDAEQPKRSIMEMPGLGKEVWESIDAQEYVNQLRDEWNRPM